MINSIIDEDDYIRESNEAMKQLLRRNDLWNEKWGIEENLRNLTINGYDLVLVRDADPETNRVYVSFMLMTTVELGGRKIIDAIKWRITGIF